MDKVYINTDFIKLQQALKLANVVGQGSDAKLIIQDGAVKVNGEVCLMRGKKLVKGDVVEFEEYRFEIDSKDE
jgi:ribosome-associated protein